MEIGIDIHLKEKDYASTEAHKWPNCESPSNVRSDRAKGAVDYLTQKVNKDQAADPNHTVLWYLSHLDMDDLSTKYVPKLLVVEVWE